MSITVYSHDDCLNHDPGIGHAENSDRLRVILKALKSSVLAEQLNFKEAPMGSDSQIMLAHSGIHLHNIETALPETGYQSLDADTILSPDSLKAARRGVGAACQGVDDLINNSSISVFCATRPPGHHATPHKAMGFCLFNNASIAALYAQQEHNLERVAVVDFDVHHGNGSQDILKGKEGILYISTHQSPLYPGTGYESENIKGNLLNVCFPENTEGTDYRPVFKDNVITALNDFKPELLIISAGFDAHAKDPLAGMALYEEDYQWIGESLKEVANQHCQCHVLAILEGGYNLDVLGGSVVAFLEGINSI